MVDWITSLVSMDLSGASKPIMLAIGGIILVGLFGFAYWYYVTKIKPYNVKVHILERDGMGTLRYVWDKGGVFVKKSTGNRLFYLKSRGVGFNTDKLPIIPDGKDLVLNLYRVSNVGYRTLQFDFDNNKMGMTIGDEDLNGAIDDWTEYVNTYAQKSFIEQFAPYIVIILCLVTVVITAQMLVGTINDHFLPVMQEVSASFAEASQSLAQAKSGTTILRGGT